MAGELARLSADPRVAVAAGHIGDHDEATIATQIELSEIPAPPFHEAARGVRMAQLMRDAGISAVETDEVGNVHGVWPGSEGDLAPDDGPLVVAAHLDTVFPAGTDVTVTRDGSKLRGPGISDDARGLATLLATARSLGAAGLRSRRQLLFVATVGEEGVGDLRGVKHLFSDEGACRQASGFISLDGAGLKRIVVGGLGSRRFRITIHGPGGHSWVDWGTPNPIHALAAVGQRLATLPLPADPVTTLTIARCGGGKSINAIPQEAWLEIDTRSEEDDRLDWLEAEIEGVIDESRSIAADALRLEVETIGRRPGGSTDPESGLVTAALAATRHVGGQAALATSSTDANIPMSLGIPAVTLGCGGEAGKAHTTDEWYENDGGPEGVLRALYTILLVAGVQE